jgi:uncharacterized protein YajQ (UPF0234 family)
MAPKDFSFDVVSQVDMQEFRNAVDQAKRELGTRYDFKASKSEIILENDKLRLVADDEFKMQQLKDIVESRFIKRGVDLRQIDYGKLETGAKMTVLHNVTVKQGISQEHAKSLAKQLKDRGLRVSAQIQGDQLRVSGKDKDELQKAIKFIESLPLEYPVEFVNYR